MQIVLYKCSCDQRHVDKTSFLTQVASLDGTLRQGSSVINPNVLVELPFALDSDSVMASNEDVVTLDGDDVVVDFGINGLLSFNYAYIPQFDRYYFVMDVTTNATGLYLLSMRVDVLMSFKDDILNQIAFVERNEFDYDSMQDDPLLPLDFIKDIQEVDSLDSGDKVNCHFQADFDSQNAYNIVLSVITNIPSWYEEIDSPDTDLPDIDPDNFSALGSATNYNINAITLAFLGDELLGANSAKASFVKSVIAFPFLVPTNDLVTKSDIPFGHYDSSDPDANVIYHNGDPIQGYGCNYASPYLVIADFVVPGALDFLDYPPYARYELFIPFYGWKELDAQQVAGHRLIVYYSVSYEDGSATAYVWDVTANREVFSNACQLGVRLSLSSSNAQENAVQREAQNTSLGINLISSALSMVGGAVTMNPLALAGGALAGGKAIASYINANAMIFDKASASLSGSTAGLYSPLKCRLRITKQKELVSDYEEFNHLYGRALKQFRSLGSLIGMTIVPSIHLEGFNAFARELEEIERLLKVGVIL